MIIWNLFLFNWPLSRWCIWMILRCDIYMQYHPIFRMWYPFNLDIFLRFPFYKTKLSFWGSLLSNNASRLGTIILSDGVAAVIRYDPHPSILPCTDVLYWRWFWCPTLLFFLTIIIPNICDSYILFQSYLPFNIVCSLFLNLRNISSLPCGWRVVCLPAWAFTIIGNILAQQFSKCVFPFQSL